MQRHENKNKVSNQATLKTITGYRHQRPMNPRYIGTGGKLQSNLTFLSLFIVGLRINETHPMHTQPLRSLNPLTPLSPLISDTSPIDRDRRDSEAGGKPYSSGGIS